MGMVKAEGILFCGGGTGGHVFPGLAVAEANRRLGGTNMRWVGDPERLEATLVPANNIPLLPCGLSRPRPKDPRWLLQACGRMWRCFREMRRQPPKVVVALGGYAALLPGLLAPVLRRPVIVLEQNALPGKTNKLLARFASAIVTQFDDAAKHLPAHKVHQLGNPVRPLQQRPRGQEQQLTVVIMGGSLSARSLNDLCIGGATALAAIPNLRIIHLAGEDDKQRVAAAYQDAGLTADVRGFCNDMPALYAEADLAVSRAGATTVAECCAAGLGALYIPLPWAADDHQTANARAVARAGGAAVLPQAVIDSAGLVRVIARLAQHRDEVHSLGERAAALARPDAARDAVHLLRMVGAGR